MVLEMRPVDSITAPQRTLGKIGRQFLWRLFLVLATWMPIPTHAETSATPEAVKASYLMLFASYTTWPSNTFASTNSPVVIGVLGTDPFGEVLDKTAHAYQGSRSMEVRRVRTPEDAAQCHLVFISQAESANESQWLAGLRSNPILTVGESSQALEHGSVVKFVAKGNRLRFEVSWSGMSRAGLKIGSEMLGSALNVYERPKLGQ